MKSLIQGIFVSVVGVLFSFLLIEIGFRIISDFSHEKPAWTDRPEFYFRDEKAATLQDYYYNPVKPQDTFRISVVGDSYTFAPYMQFTDTFPKKLEQMLNLNDVKLKAEVINHGVPAYSTSHEIPVVEKAIKEQSDLIILQVTLNDAELKGLVPRGITADQEDPFGDIVFSPRMATVVSYWKSLGFVLTRLHNQKTHTNYKNYFNGLFEKKRNWSAFADSFSRIQELCKKSNIKLVVVVFPLFGVPMDEDYPFKVTHDKLEKFYTEKGVAHLDLLQAYMGIPIDRIQVIPGVDRHGNELTHRIAAEKIYSWLEKNSFIPDELKIRFKYEERLGITNRGKI